MSLAEMISLALHSPYWDMLTFPVDSQWSGNICFVAHPLTVSVITLKALCIAGAFSQFTHSVAVVTGILWLPQIWQLLILSVMCVWWHTLLNWLSDIALFLCKECQLWTGMLEFSVLRVFHRLCRFGIWVHHSINSLSLFPLLDIWQKK